MKILKIEPQGYCGGVKNAIEIATKALNDPNTKRPIYMLGNIIHNKYVVKSLEDLGLITINNNKTRYEMLDEIDSGTVIFSAHGVCDKVVLKAQNKGLNIINTTCPNVLLVHNKIKDYLKNGYDVIYIGKENHPETEGVLGINSNIHFIDNIESINNLNIINDKIYVTNQTTLSIYDLEEYFNLIKEKYSNAIIDNKICQATTKRQKALMNLECDLLIVVGDKTSSNSKRLQSVCQKYSLIKSYLVEDETELDKNWFLNIDTVGITSGASTPDYITNRVIEKIKEYDKKK